MRMTNIKIAQKVNTGKYESLDFEAEAIIDEDDDPNAAATKLANFVDWHARKPIRDLQLITFQNTLNNPEAPATEAAYAQKWVTKYNERKLAVEGTFNATEVVDQSE